MAELITLTANWTTGKVSSGMISRQYDNNRYCIKFTGIPDDGGENLIYYLLIYMKTEEGAAPVILAPVQLASDEWIISNYFTQIVQQIKFQLCVQNEGGTFEAHSPIFDGSIRDSLDHDGEDIDIDTSELFDYYRAYVEERVSELIVAAGAVQIDTSLSVSGAAAEAAAVGAALSSTNERLEELEQGGTGGADVPTEVRQALYRLFNNNAFSSSAGFTSDIAVLQSWATEVTDITISQSAISISGANTSQLTAVTSPTGGLVTWTSSDASVATVSSSGLVTGIGNGTAKITASCGGKKAVCTATVSGFATLTGITATYTQSGAVYPSTELDTLKNDLVVVASYSDSTTRTLTASDYTLSGTLISGTRTVTVSYGGYSDTFTVNVSSAPPLYTLKQGATAMSSGNSITLSDGSHCEVVTTTNGRIACLNQTTGNAGAPQNLKTTIFTLSPGDEWEFKVKNIEFASNTDAANYFGTRLFNLANATDVGSGQIAYSELTPGTLADVTATGTIETATNVTSVQFYFHRPCEFEFDFEFYVNGVRYL